MRSRGVVDRRRRWGVGSRPKACVRVPEVNAAVLGRSPTSSVSTRSIPRTVWTRRPAIIPVLEVRRPAVAVAPGNFELSMLESISWRRWGYGGGRTHRWGRLDVFGAQDVAGGVCEADGVDFRLRGVLAWGRRRKRDGSKSTQGGDRRDRWIECGGVRGGDLLRLRRRREGGRRKTKMSPRSGFSAECLASFEVDVAFLRSSQCGGVAFSPRSAGRCSVSIEGGWVLELRRVCVASKWWDRVHRMSKISSGCGRLTLSPVNSPLPRSWPYQRHRNPALGDRYALASSRVVAVAPYPLVPRPDVVVSFRSLQSM